MRSHTTTVGDFIVFIACGWVGGWVGVQFIPCRATIQSRILKGAKTRATQGKNKGERKKERKKGILGKKDNIHSRM